MAARSPARSRLDGVAKSLACPLAPPHVTATWRAEDGALQGRECHLMTSTCGFVSPYSTARSLPMAAMRDAASGTSMEPK